MEQSPHKLELLRRIAELERQELWHLDVEDDPETFPLMPDQVDYLNQKLSSKIKCKSAYSMARKFLNGILENKQMIVRDIVGVENFAALESGAIVTCNHFNAFDSFAMQMAYESAGHKKRKLYRVIREGNYTSFPGFYGYLMKNYNII